MAYRERLFNRSYQPELRDEKKGDLGFMGVLIMSVPRLRNYVFAVENSDLRLQFPFLDIKFIYIHIYIYMNNEIVYGSSKRQFREIPCQSSG